MKSIYVFETIDFDVILRVCAENEEKALKICQELTPLELLFLGCQSEMRQL